MDQGDLAGSQVGEIGAVEALQRSSFPNWVSEDTMADIIDPATKKKLDVPLCMMKATNGLRYYFDNRNKQRRRESYLCMLYQKERCKSFMKCNQIHADRQFVRGEREKHEGYDVEPHTDQRLLEIIVADPSNPLSKVVIPYTKTSDSEGRRVYLEAQKQPTDAHPSNGLYAPQFLLCPGLLQAGKCLFPTGPRFCPHIHAQLDFIQFLRRPRACCCYHGDNIPPLNFRGRIFMVNRHNQRCLLSQYRITETQGLRELVGPNSSLLIFNANRACRMYLEGKCPFESECANLHICREFYAFYINVMNPQLVQLEQPHPMMGGMMGGPPSLEEQLAHGMRPDLAAPDKWTDRGSADAGAGAGAGASGAGAGAAGVGGGGGYNRGGVGESGLGGGNGTGSLLSQAAQNDPLQGAFKGIPLFTEEGPVPTDLLPPEVAQFVQHRLPELMGGVDVSAVAGGMGASSGFNWGGGASPTMAGMAGGDLTGLGGGWGADAGNKGWGSEDR